MNPAHSPLACELFRQWQRTRGGRDKPAARPFSRGWEELLEAGGLVTAIERADALGDARTLAGRGWVEIKSKRYQTNQIERIAIPLAAEELWAGAFGFVRPSDAESGRIREFPWVPAMAFVRDLRSNVPFEDLRRLNEFLLGGPREVVPIKERSLEIFGDEKRLDALVGSALFRDGRLDAARDFFCEAIGVPMAWKRGPASASGGPVLVLENAATWHSFCRWNDNAARFSAIVYGDGNRFIDGVRYLPDLFGELGAPRPISYFGDLDPQGLRIPQIASRKCRERGWLPVEPLAWAYRLLLENGIPQAWDGDPPEDELCDWLGDSAGPARQLFLNRQRLAQEHVGWECLVSSVGLRGI